MTAKLLLQISCFLLFGLLCLAPLNWRQCIKLALVVLVLEGALRKWVFPGASHLVYFAKDFLVLTAYLKYYRRKPEADGLGLVGAELWPLVVTSFIICIAQIVNINLGSAVVGFVGARNYILYIPLMYIMKDLFRSKKELTDFLLWYLLLVIPVFLLAIKQHLSPPDSPWNIYARSEEIGIAMVGDSVRVTGTFSYLAGYASYLQTMAALVVPLLLLDLPPFWRFASRGIFVSVAASILLTGSRGPVIGMGLFLVLYLLLNRIVRQMGLYRRFVIPGIIAAFALIIGLQTVLQSFGGRLTENRDIAPRILSSFTAPFEYMSEAGFLGFGVGSTFQATPMVRKVFDLPEGTEIPVFVENEPQRVMFELGPVGFLAWYALRIMLIVALWQTHSKCRVPLYRELALTGCLVHVIGFPGQMVFQITFLVYYWFLAGFIFLLPRLERIEMMEMGMIDERGAAA